MLINRHCRVRFYTSVGQPLSKQLYIKGCAVRLISKMSIKQVGNALSVMGMRPSTILWTWRSQRTRCWRRSVNMDGIPALKSTSLLDALSCHVIPRIRRRHLGWNTWSFCSCVEYEVQDSLPYKRELTTQALSTDFSGNCKILVLNSLWVWRALLMFCQCACWVQHPTESTTLFYLHSPDQFDLKAEIVYSRCYH